MSDSMERNWNGEFFKAEDFYSKVGDNPWDTDLNIREWAASISNAILREEIEKLKTVYGPNMYFYSTNPGEVFESWITCEGNFKSRTKILPPKEIEK